MIEVGSKVIIRDNTNFYNGLKAVVTEVYNYPEITVYAVKIDNVSFVVSAPKVEEVKPSLRAKTVLKAAKEKFNCEYLDGPFLSKDCMYVVYDSLDNEKGVTKSYETVTAYVTSLNQLSMDQWLSEFEDVINLAKLNDI